MSFRALFAPYLFRKVNYPKPGAGGFALEREVMNVESVNGSGNEYPPLPFLQAPQVYVYPTAVTEGLGGLQAGQFYSQPLDTYEVTNAS